MKHLSRFDIKAIAGKYVQAYMALPDVRNTQIYRIDPELLLEKVLGLNVEYQHLSYDGSILGMTSFTEMGVQVFEDNDSEAFFFLDGKTVLVEKELNFDSKLKGRKNFTLMHEGSHQIFKMLFPNDYGIRIFDFNQIQKFKFKEITTMTKLTLEQQELLFANDCKLINLRYEYHGYTGTEKWAIVTELAEEELWVKYPDVIRRYTPFILLSMAQGEVITEYQNYEARERMRRLLFRTRI